MNGLGLLIYDFKSLIHLSNDNSCQSLRLFISQIAPTCSHINHGFTLELIETEIRRRRKQLPNIG